MNKNFPDIQVVDDQDNIIGQIQWSEAQGKPINVRIAKAILHNGAGSLLMQKRSQNVKMPGRWCETAAGHVDAGESYEHAVYRELEEETSVTGVDLRKFAYFYEVEDSGARKFFTCYIGQYDGPIDGYDESEVETMEWWSLDRVKSEVEKNPKKFTRSFRTVLPKVIENIS